MKDGGGGGGGGGGDGFLVDSPTLAHLLLATAFVYKRAATTKCIFIYEIQAFRPG